MTFDTQDHKDFILQMVNAASFKGEALEHALKKAILEAKIESPDVGVQSPVDVIEPSALPPVQVHFPSRIDR